MQHLLGRARRAFSSKCVAPDDNRQAATTSKVDGAVPIDGAEFCVACHDNSGVGPRGILVNVLGGHDPQAVDEGRCGGLAFGAAQNSLHSGKVTNVIIVNTVLGGDLDRACQQAATSVSMHS